MRYVLFIALIIFFVILAACTTQTPTPATKTPKPISTTLPTLTPSPIPPTNIETSFPEKNASNYLNEKRPVTPSPFIGTTWILKTYQDSDGQMVDYVPTTMMVNVLFNASGHFSGFDGCNWHGGSYTLIGQNGISMNTHGPTTLMFCFGRETPYLSLLSSISSYETTTDGMLNLKDANGTVVLVYSGQ